MMNWLSIIIILLIVGIVLDGVRRVRKSRREGLQLSRRAKELDSDETIRVSDSEFPSGGARVAVRRDVEEAESLNLNVRKSFEDSKKTVGAPARDPEQRSLNLEEVVPMLMDSIEPAEIATESEPSLGDMESLDEPQAQTVEQRKPEKRTSQPAATNTSDPDAELSEVLIVSVMAKSGERFDGEALLQAILAQNMKFGEMDIFHRHEHDDGDGEALFGLANMVVPGTFNLSEMASFSTPGVSLFMRLPLESDSLEAFDVMAKAARGLAQQLQGELKDENRSVMTNQTFEHYRQRVVEFERRRKLQHA